MTDTPLSLTADDFRYAFRSHPAAGVAIVTADAGDGPVAMTVSSVASVSIAPPTLVFSASALSSSTPTILRADTVVVHMLAADQLALAKLGAQRGVDRFGSDVDWDRLPTGEPYYPGAHWLRGRIVQRVDASGSTLIVVEAIEAKPRGETEEHDPTPLVYHNRQWHTLSERSALPAATVPFCVVYGRDE
ncbi:flavin reductase (DIM6/NTAB) family NADH-FMN oxidoreductase RutF [Microbacterium testaceum]|uniref:flavin reductase family protein n=1 Tax=Microbacterium testaceum TaxID=2033 RepID=UPI002786C753|nr:flavin reductase family protein [Microbacterium testaceum]MDQ1115594.1 flavin reductase (DIM6/NTAB) family NADH-FMN oxidoreductase RutF [Microbacterium testaceum]